MKENSKKGGEYAKQTILVLWKQRRHLAKYRQRHINTIRLLSFYWSKVLTIIPLNAE